jgi:drug/metabolite transporter (DMT)-like permease
LSFAALVLGSVAIGASPIFVRLSELGPIATAFHRTLWALPPLWLWSRLNGAQARMPIAPRHVGLLALCGLFFVGDLVFWHWSILRTTVANATLFANFSPLIVTAGAWFVLSEKISSNFLIGMGLALTGAALLMGASLELDRRHVLGDGLGLVTAIFFGSYMIAVARARRHLQAGVVMFWSTGVTCAGLLVAAWFAGETIVPQTGRGLAVVVGLALLSQVAGQGLIAYALGHLRASFSSLVILIEPLTAAILGWFILSEAISVWQWLGGAAILIGVYLARGLARRPRFPVDLSVR